MASLLRQIVAGPRSRHPEAGLDLCYVTDQIIATSGPSGTYPQRAYRNPLDQLVKFLDYKHGAEWAIWEFRAEGTGYPDSEVYGRVWHYPWPDHHPPPFRLVPMIMAGMRNWLNEEGKGAGGEDGAGGKGESGGVGNGEGKNDVAGEKKEGTQLVGKEGKKRVVVVHCKAGKGRSGSMACSYLISECGWKPSEALARFTERRMRPGFGQGVSIPSQLRWIGYVDRWTQGGKVYLERQIEIMEVHVWGLREGVKVQVEGYVDEGKTIKVFHVFNKKERVIVEGSTPNAGGVVNKASDIAGFQNQGKIDTAKSRSADQLAGPNTTGTSDPPSAAGSTTSVEASGTESGGGAVIFKPSTRVILPSSDVNIDFERRNKASMGWTMVTAVAHVWFNTFFEGNGPENNGVPDPSGLFEIDWDKMDGLKGSSRKGTRAFDRLAVVWKAFDPDPGHAHKEDVIHEPGTDSPVPQMAPADWKGHNHEAPPLGRNLGLRAENPASAGVSKASSFNEAATDDNDSEEGVKPSGPEGEEELDEANSESGTTPQVTMTPPPEPSIEAVNAGLDTASGTTAQRGTEITSPTTSAPNAFSPEPVVATSDLPDGKPEEEMKTPHAHGLGHLKPVKHAPTS